LIVAGATLIIESAGQHLCAELLVVISSRGTVRFLLDSGTGG